MSLPEDSWPISGRLQTQEWKSTSGLTLLACQEHILTTIHRPSCPLALPRIHHSPRVGIPPPLEQLHATDQQHPRKLKINIFRPKLLHPQVPFPQEWMMLKAGICFQLTFFPVTACVVAIDIPSGFSTSLSPPFHTFEPWTRKAKIKLVTGFPILCCSQQQVPKLPFYCSSVNTGVSFPCRKARYLAQGNVSLPSSRPKKAR